MKNSLNSLCVLIALFLPSLLLAEESEENTLVKEIERAVAEAKLPPGDMRAFQVKGTVEIMDAQGNLERLKRGAKIQQGVTIITGENSGTLLMLSNGSTLNLGAKTKFEIAVYLQEPFDPAKGRYAMLKADPSTSKTHAYIHHGEVIGTVKKLHSTSTFAIESPIGSAGVRGTTFFVSFGINQDSGNYMMQISNFDGNVVVESQLEAQVVMSDGSVAAGKYNPYSGPKLYEIPKKTLVVLEADRSLNLGNPEDMPTHSTITEFKDFFENDNIQRMIDEVVAANGGDGDSMIFIDPTPPQITPTTTSY